MFFALPGSKQAWPKSAACWSPTTPEIQPSGGRGGLTGLARACARHPWRTLGSWLVAVVIIIFVTATAGGTLVDEFTIPNSDTQRAIDLLAERFRALAEPARLQLMNVLRDGEYSVTELVEETGLGQANVSKHLQLLRTRGFVERRKEGLYVFYRIADPAVFELCDLMCGHVERHALARGDLFKP